MMISIPGNPIPLERHRSFMKKGCIKQYDPQVTAKVIFQMIMEQEIKKQKKNDYLLKDAPYEITIIFEMPFPLSKRKKKMPPLEDIPHTTKPDIDNLIKFVLDCGNGIIWKDDRYINSIKAKKVYSDNPKTIIHILL